MGTVKSVLASEIKTGDVTLNDPTAEIRMFLKDTEPKEFTVNEIKARITNLKLACKEIRRLVANKKVSDSGAGALDTMRQEAEVELLNLTDALPAAQLKQEQAEPVEAIFDVADHIAAYFLWSRGY